MRSYRGEISAQRADLAESARTGAADPAKGQSFTLKIRKLVQTGDDNTNILLYPGDRVTVQQGRPGLRHGSSCAPRVDTC